MMSRAELHLHPLMIASSGAIILPLFAKSPYRWQSSKKAKPPDNIVKRRVFAKCP